MADLAGMVWQNGETWQDMRQCVMKALGGCGMQSAMQSESLEERIQHEVNKLVREFAKFEQECKPFCPFDLLHKAVCNIICSIVFGCRSRGFSPAGTKHLDGCVAQLVERWSLTGELSLSCARPAAGG